MRLSENENNILTDFSAFKWMSFIPGETSIDDLSLMKIESTEEKFMRYIIPDHYFTPTYCLQFVVKGSMNLMFNGKHYEVKANDAFLAMPELRVSKLDMTDNYVEMYVLSMSRKFIQELNLQFPIAFVSYFYVHPLWQLTAEQTERVIQYMNLLRELVEDKNRTATLHLIRSLMYCLAGEENNRYRIPASSRNEEITGRFLNLVDEYCQQHHALEWYAAELCLSARYVANTVKMTLGITATECIENALIRRAQALLHTTSMPIQEIADQLGFKNQSHFGTFFRRHTGLSPKAFRLSPPIMR